MRPQMARIEMKLGRCGSDGDFDTDPGGAAESIATTGRLRDAGAE
jgi:hypothetical protein